MELIKKKRKARHFLLPECVTLDDFPQSRYLRTLFCLALWLPLQWPSPTWTHIPIIQEAAETEAALFATRSALSVPYAS